MEKITKKAATPFENGPDCRGVEYNLKTKTFNGAHIEVAGRYPRDGEAMNEVCEEICYITSGFGVLIQGSRRMDFVAGDTIYLDKGESYAWEGSFGMYVVCSPAFYPEQHKEIGE